MALNRQRATSALLSSPPDVPFGAQALECVMADNTFERTGGLSAWARSVDAHGWGTNHRNMLLDNRVVEGNHVYNYDTKPNRWVRTVCNGM